MQVKKSISNSPTKSPTLTKRKPVSTTAAEPKAGEIKDSLELSSTALTPRVDLKSESITLEGGYDSHSINTDVLERNAGIKNLEPSYSDKNFANTERDFYQVDGTLILKESGVRRKDSDAVLTARTSRLLQEVYPRRGFQEHIQSIIGQDKDNRFFVSSGSIRGIFETMGTTTDTIQGYFQD